MKQIVNYRRQCSSILMAVILLFELITAATPAYASEQKQGAAQKSITGTAYYLDSQNGNDDNSGTTPSQAWKSLSRIEELTFEPGDAILLRAGSVFSGGIIRPKGSGTKDNPIIVDMYEGDIIGEKAGKRPVIHGGVHIGDHNFQGAKYATIWLENVDYWTVNNLEITNYGEGAALRAGVYVTAQSKTDSPSNYIMRGIHLNNLYVHDVNGARDHKDDMNGGIVVTSFGLWTGGKEGTDQNKIVKFDDISVENCYVKDVSRTGISVGCSTGFYKSFTLVNEVEGDSKSPMIFPEGTIEKYANTNIVIKNNFVERTGGDGIVVQHSDAPLVESNICAYASQSTKEDPYGGMVNAGIWTWQCNNALFQFNEAYGTVENYDGEAYDCDYGVGTIYQYNYSHDNEGGFMLLCDGEAVDSIIRYNISQNDQRSLFFISSPNGEIYNNTFYIGSEMDTGVVSAYKGAGGNGVRMQNNIFYNLGKNKDWSGIPNTDLMEAKGITEQTLENALESNNNIKYSHNLYFGYNKESLPYDSGGILEDPLFIDPGKGKAGTLENPGITTLDGYKLKEGSPAIGTGIFMGGDVQADFFGNNVGVHVPDIGAYQSTPTLEAKEAFIYSSDYKVDQQKSAVYVNTGVPDYKELLSKLLTGENTTLEVFSSSGQPVIAGLLTTGMRVVARNGRNTKTYSINISEAEKNELDLYVYSDIHTIDQEALTITVEGLQPDIETFSSDIRLTANGRFKVLDGNGAAVYSGPLTSNMTVHASSGSIAESKNYTVIVKDENSFAYIYSDIYEISQIKKAITLQDSELDYAAFLAGLHASAGSSITIISDGEEVTSGVITSGMKVLVKNDHDFRSYRINVNPPQELYIYSDIYRIDEDTMTVYINSSQTDFDVFMSGLHVSEGGKIQILKEGKVTYTEAIVTGMVIHINNSSNTKNYSIVVE